MAGKKSPICWGGPRPRPETCSIGDWRTCGKSSPAWESAPRWTHEGGADAGELRPPAGDSSFGTDRPHLLSHSGGASGSVEAGDFRGRAPPSYRPHHGVPLLSPRIRTVAFGGEGRAAASLSSSDGA